MGRWDMDYPVVAVGQRIIPDIFVSPRRGGGALCWRDVVPQYP